MKKFAFFLVLLSSCTNNEDTVAVLESQGFTDVHTTGYAWNKCGEGDSTCTGFVARGQNGHTVRGAVGCGRGCGKGCTVRITYTSKTTYNTLSD